MPEIVSQFDPENGNLVSADPHAILSWYKNDKIGAHLHIYFQDKVWTRIDYGHHKARKEFILQLLRNNEERLSMRGRFLMSEGEVTQMCDQLIEQLESLESSKIEP